MTLHLNPQKHIISLQNSRPILRAPIHYVELQIYAMKTVNVAPHCSTSMTVNVTLMDFYGQVSLSIANTTPEHLIINPGELITRVLLRLDRCATFSILGSHVL